MAARPGSALRVLPGSNSHLQPLRHAGPTTSSHGDIFPLPISGLAPPDRSQRRAAMQAAARRRVRHAGVVVSVVSLNALATASALSPLAVVDPPSRAPSVPQASVLSRVGRRVSRRGCQPGLPPKDPLLKLIKTTDMSDADPQGLKVFNAARLKVRKRPMCTKPLESLLTGFALEQHPQPSATSSARPARSWHGPRKA